ncbi:YqeG family HAD IIIA-type phosphatase [Irregularibacter muris]|uniref:YqeG family HAD IIIA-type phosphatase n=1 Tax=Irregularibacter muris TaxID=1796619 RepID=A0AAE3HEE7_9FIRM|nr:YqeG family HAD IIIA-type phosphatase [Irregularibacter muris]MCR1897969.1 YqeG family HAD IIIA-type phosphatase [Irregularibacter muris]
MANLKPNMMLDSIFQLDFQDLKSRNIKGLLVDLDNTLVEWDKKKADERLIQWFYQVKEEGFSICIISNNTEDRVVEFKEDLDLPAIHKALKPLTRAFRKGVKILGLKKEQVAVIGDQIFTDVLGGNRAGLFTILVKPIGNQEFWWTTFVRRIEKRLLKRLLNPEEVIIRTNEDK